jgi:hypothetical protein
VFFAFLLLGIITYNVVVSLVFGLLLIFGIWNCGYHYSKKYTIGNGYIEESSILKRKKLIAYVDISEAEIKQGDNVTYILLFDKRSKRPIIKINMYYENAFLIKELAYKMNWLKWFLKSTNSCFTDYDIAPAIKIDRTVNNESELHSKRSIWCTLTFERPQFSGLFVSWYILAALVTMEENLPAFVAISVSVYILGILHMNYEFTAFDKGMRFIIELTPLRTASVPIVT